MLAIETHVQWIITVAARGDGNTDTVRGHIRVIGVGTGFSLSLGFVEFEANLGQIIEFGDGVASHFGRNAAFNQAVEEGVDMGF